MAQKYSRLPWGSNYRKPPPWVQRKLTAIGKEDFIVAYSQIITAEDLTEGRYRHLEIEAEADIPTAGYSLLPSSTVGPTSYYNVSLEEKPNKRGAKVPKTISGVAPNGRGRGFHRTRYTRPVWPTQLYVPRLSRIALKRIGGTSDPLGIVVKFEVQEVLNASMPDFRKQVLRCVNLLKENVGKIDLLPLNATDAEYIRRASEDIGWEIVPDSKPGEVRNLIARKLGKRNPQARKQAQERLEVILNLKPQHRIQGSKGFGGYFAAQFTDKLTVFENLEADHAMYVVRGEWKEVSKLTRFDIQAKYGSDCERIIHSRGWEQRLTRLVKEARGEISE